MTDYSALCLLGSKECTRIAEYIYSDPDEIAILEQAHIAYAVMSFVNTIGPMFAVNAWIDPFSQRYEVSIIDNGKEDIWVYSYMFYVVEYGIASVLSIITFLWDSGMLRRMYEAWYGTWNIIVMTCFCGMQMFWFWPSDYYLGEYPWQVMLVYVSFWVEHVIVWSLFRTNLYRWAYGQNAYAENLDDEDNDYCCYSYTSGNGSTVKSIKNCAIHREDPNKGNRVCNKSCSVWNFCEWYDTLEDIQAVSSTIMLLEGETMDFCCDDFDEDAQQWLCRKIPNSRAGTCYEYCVHYGLCNYFDWATPDNLVILERDFCCAGLNDGGAAAGAIHPCAPISDLLTCDSLCASYDLCARTTLDWVDLAAEIYWDLSF